MPTITPPTNITPPGADPATTMLHHLLADIQPSDLDDLLDLAGLVGEVDGGHITAATIGGGRR